MDIQVRLPAALAALHNFIRDSDPSEIGEFFDEEEEPQTGELQQPSAGELAEGLPNTAERKRADARQRKIADAMWAQYKQELRRRGLA